MEQKRSEERDKRCEVCGGEWLTTKAADWRREEERGRLRCELRWDLQLKLCKLKTLQVKAGESERESESESIEH